MGSITITGVLLWPSSGFAVGDTVRFTHTNTTGSTIKGASSIFVIPSNGAYSIELQYGDVLIEYKPSLSNNFKRIKIATVDVSAVEVTLTELING